MDIRDSERLARLKKTFELNGKLTVLYASYLERFPEFITAEMMDCLCGDGEISREYGFSALLTEAFCLDPDTDRDDKRLVREYLPRSVRVLDAQRYRNNLYYKTVKAANVKEGSWEIRTEVYPAYRGVICHDMIINEDFSEIPPLGFFTEDFEFIAVLEDGNEWMTLTPVDLDTCDFAIEAAHGKVVTFGLGLGYYAFMAAMKPEVESVTVVEISDKVISLFEKYLKPHFPCKDKIKVVCSDAFAYMKDSMPKENFDYAFVDIWRDASDGTPIYEKMKELEALSPNTEFSYWIENFLISRRRALRFSEILDSIEDNECEMSYGEIENELKGLGTPVRYD